MQDELSSETSPPATGDDTEFKEDKIENNNVDIEISGAGDVPMDEAEGDVEKVEEDIPEEKTFLDDISLEAEADEKEDDEDMDKSADKIKMIDRKAVIINIDKTKTNDDIEDYLFDNYPESGITSFKVLRRIPYRVIVVFESPARCDDFLTGPFLKDHLIGFKNKMKKLSLAEFRGQAAERRKVHEKIAESLVVSCEGFGAPETKETILAYMKDNHEEVSQIEQKEDGKFIMTFASKAGAAKFAGLSYVKCRGRAISRTVLVPVQRFKTDRKPLVNGTNELNRKRKLTSSKEVGSSFKLTGFQNSSTNYKTIQESLQMIGINKTDVQFIRYCADKKDAVVTLRAGDVGKILDIFKQRPVFINKDKISAEMVKNVPGENTNNKPKRFKSTDNLQKNKIRAWTHY